jgi:hypothetical protein
MPLIHNTPLVDSTQVVRRMPPVTATSFEPL